MDVDEKGEFPLCGMFLQIEILLFTQAAINVKCHGECLQVVETHLNVIERRCSTTERRIRDVRSGILFYIYIANISAKAVSLPKHMIVPLQTNSTRYIVCTENDQPDTMGVYRLASSYTWGQRGTRDK